MIPSIIAQQLARQGLLDADVLRFEAWTAAHIRPLRLPVVPGSIQETLQRRLVPWPPEENER